MGVIQQNYTIGSGKLLFMPEGENGYMDFGNVVDHTITKTIETIEHITTRSGFHVSDKEVAIKQEATGKFKLDDITPENLNLFLHGGGVINVSQSAGSVTDKDLTAVSGMWVLVGHIEIDNVVVKSEDDQTTYDEGEDYYVDKKAGMIFFDPEGNIQNGSTVKVSYDHAEITYKRIYAAQGNQLLGHIYHVGDPPTGAVIDVKGYVSLKPAGDLTLISREWMQLEFEYKFLDHEDYTGLFDLDFRGVRQ